MQIERSHWIFDLDGTLTVAVHDFDEIRRRLGIPDGRGILESLRMLPDEERIPIERELDELEYDLAKRSTIADGAAEVLSALSSRGVRIGLVTRNNRLNVKTTLSAIGLEQYFSDGLVITREDHLAPKPAPDGLLELFRRWDAHPSNGVMVGNHAIDVEAGRDAGVTTVHVTAERGTRCHDCADLCIGSLAELLTAPVR